MEEAGRLLTPVWLERSGWGCAKSCDGVQSYASLIQYYFLTLESANYNNTNNVQMWSLFNLFTLYPFRSPFNLSLHI